MNYIIVYGICLDSLIPYQWLTKKGLFSLHFGYSLALLPNTHFASTPFPIIFHNYILLYSTYISIFSFISVYIENILI